MACFLLQIAKEASEVFALTVFCCDGYLRLHDEDTGIDGENARRFFRMLQGVPMEIQMMVCNFSRDLYKEVVISGLTEKSLKRLTKSFLEE